MDDTGESANATGNEVIKYVSDEAAFYFNLIVTVLLCGIISIFGIAANVINITVFVRQGVFSESTNVSLLGLAVSELMSTATMLWMSVSFAVALADPPGLIWNPYDVMYLTAGWPHTICGLITRCITAFIAFERCFCVVFPFKVNRVFTPRRSFISMICIFAYYFISYSPVFIVIQFRRVTDPTTNETRIVLQQDPHLELVELVLGYINLFTLNLGSVSVVLICTTIMVSRVKLSSAWRKSMSSAGNRNSNSNGNHSNHATNNNDNINAQTKSTSVTQTQSVCESKSKEYEHTLEKSNYSNSIKNANTTTDKTKIDKEAKLVKMITLICGIFLICYSPNIVFLVMYSIDIEIRVMGEQDNLAMMSFAISFLFESFNSCINIVLYYKMSSRFKKEFNILFGRDKKST